MKALVRWSIFFRIQNVTHQTDQCMIEAAKCMLHELLGEACDDLGRVALQSREDFRAKSSQHARRCWIKLQRSISQAT